MAEQAAVEVSDGPWLSVELVPQTCWFSNLRSELSTVDWERCKRYARKRSGSKCEICGGVGTQYPVACHECWAYVIEDGKPIQRLLGLIALCPSCHDVKHIGLAMSQGRGHVAITQLCRVNRWSPEAAEDYLQYALDEWHERSRYKWELDVSWLATIGIEVPRTRRR